MKPPPQTIKEKILHAALALGEPGKPFGAEALVIAAWERYPEVFALAGYDHPDSNKVLSTLMGEKGMVRCGLFERLGAKRYAVTAAGLRYAEQPAGRRAVGPLVPVVAAGGPIRLDRDAETKVRALLAQAAYDKHRQGLAADKSFAEALAFVEAGGASVAVLLAVLVQMLAAGPALLRDGMHFQLAEAQALQATCAYVQKRYGRHLALMRLRDQRAQPPISRQPLGRPI